ncbi:hypothetical protein PGT21_011186 [Puccinia graminis f. sp. tritici]|uniref:Uncharacterized protein n=1 Tax=Puccinia graminis f. sp. tritici TaxID=56615 RepID=A0A5B0PT80_PUCGR|nr:hypothetical protein PGT21_011186 [Puccinia graminis f. sp. tritici]
MMKHYALMLVLSFACLIGHSIGASAESLVVPEESWKSAAQLSQEDHPAGYNLWKNTPKLEITDGRNGVKTFEHTLNHPSKATFQWNTLRTPVLNNLSDHPIQFLLRHVNTQSFLYWPVVTQGHKQLLEIPKRFILSGPFELHIAESPADVLKSLAELKPASSSSS